jgi:hypothetical protein
MNNTKNIENNPILQRRGTFDWTLLFTLFNGTSFIYFVKVNFNIFCNNYRLAFFWGLNVRVLIFDSTHRNIGITSLLFKNKAEG